MFTFPWYTHFIKSPFLLKSTSFPTYLHCTYHKPFLLLYGESRSHWNKLSLYFCFNVFSVRLIIKCMFPSCDPANGCVWLRTHPLACAYFLTSFHFFYYQRGDSPTVLIISQNYLFFHKRLLMTHPHVLFSVLFLYKVLPHPAPIPRLEVSRLSYLIANDRLWMPYLCFFSI